MGRGTAHRAVAGRCRPLTAFGAERKDRGSVSPPPRSAWSPSPARRGGKTRGSSAHTCPLALMEWERERSPWSRTALRAAAQRPATPVLEQDARPRNAPPRHQGGGCRSGMGPRMNDQHEAFGRMSIQETLRAAILRTVIVAAALGTLFATQASAGELKGPGRFCGYSPIIDLLPGETITTLGGGIHGGSFRWEGAFGSLDVHGIGWASRPKGRLVEGPSGTRPARFAQRRVDQRFQIAIWNGAHGAAYFSSTMPLTALQRSAIRRVTLFEEGQTPSGCDLRTVFVWD